MGRGGDKLLRIAHLLDEQLALGQLLLGGGQSLLVVGLCRLELRQARQQRLHFRAHLADEESSVRELIVALANVHLQTTTNNATLTQCNHSKTSAQERKRTGVFQFHSKSRAISSQSIHS